ncbi:flagellar motor protein MotB [Methylobacterium sp. C25]|uniref:flagellar motor protein MotB n=1 Tax=Methylobacterium sp. C25 TaxID=2721622 RepID=UPI001F2C20E9|nr:flagellar motor protein MotB [Methylobacterium sp. C25]MCE4224644.1 flagellar motor protein MotB [Methylobacterium sp. C25]
MTSAPPPSLLRHRIGWLAGLPVLALLWAGATVVTSPVIDDALREESAAIVRAAIGDEPEPWLRVEVQGRDLLALGETADAASRDAALTRLRAIPALRRLDDRTGLIETISPFDWTATRTAPDRIETGGHRPVEIGAAALASRLASALPPDATLRDRARAARGGPEGFAEAATYLVGALRGFAPGAVAAVSGTTLSIRGEAIDPAAYEAALSAGPPQGFTLDTTGIVPPRVDDFRFVVERRPDGAITLGGNVVSEAARTEAVAMATSLGAGDAPDTGTRAKVGDTLLPARGLDPAIDPTELTKAAIRLAGLIRQGSVRFERGRLSISGVALDEEAAGEAETAMRDGRPAGVAAGSVDLQFRPISPYPFRIRREAGRVTLSGYLPDRAARERLNAALRLRFLRETIVDRSRISSGAPAQFVTALTGSLGPLSTLASGELEFTDASIRLTGESLYAQSARRVGDDLQRALPPGWQSTATVSSRDAEPAYDAATCARLFSERVAGHTLRFAPGSSELKPDFYPVLDAVAEIAKACRTEHVEVLGHLDPAGTPPPKPVTLPEAAAEKTKKDKVKADKSKASDKAKPAGAGKAADKTTTAASSTEPAHPAKDPEPAPDLAAARAAAIVDYLLKAGVPPDRAMATQGGAPLSDRQGIGLALRS